jgi:hypothetical protein
MASGIAKQRTATNSHVPRPTRKAEESILPFSRIEARIAPFGGGLTACSFGKAQRTQPEAELKGPKVFGHV